MLNRRALFKTIAAVGLVEASRNLPWSLFERLGFTAKDWIAEAVTLTQNYKIRAPILVNDFSSSTGMTLTQGTGTVALETDLTYVRTGTKSLKIKQLASASSALVDLDCRTTAMGGTGAEGFSAAADNLWHLRCFIDTPNNQNNLSFFVSNTAGGFTDYFTQNVMGPQISSSLTGRWWDRVENRKDWTTGGGSPAWATPVRTIRIRPNANANGALTTWIDAVYRGGYARPHVIICFDDSSAEQYTLAKPVLDTFGLKGTFYCIGQNIANNTAGAISQAQADTLYAAGHDIAYHAWTNNDHNNYASLNAQDLQLSHANFQDWARARGYERSRFHHAMPNGTTTSLVTAVMQANGTLTGRGTLRLIQNHVLGLDDRFNLRAYSWAAADSTSGPLAWFQSCIAYGSTLFLVFHTIHATTSTGSQISVADFTTIMNNLAMLQRANLLDVSTVSSWYTGLSSGRVKRP